jgi:hypothetical protein
MLKFIDELGMKTQIYLTLFILGAFFSGSYVYGQDFTESSNDYNNNLIYGHQGAVGAFLHSEGWGVFYRRAKEVSLTNKRFWEAETATMHNPKEHKVDNTNYSDASSYYFGKLNGMQVFRLGAGYSTTIARKPNQRQVEIDVVYAAGLSVAVTKPYYLQIITNPGSTSDGYILSDEIYNPKTDTPSNIYGRASVLDGIEQLSFYPGLYARGGFNFDFASKHKRIEALEAGVEFDGYPKVIPIMAYTKNAQIFANFYLSFSIGSRWN